LVCEGLQASRENQDQKATQDSQGSRDLKVHLDLQEIKARMDSQAKQDSKVHRAHQVSQVSQELMD
jgi:hypothetical protein